MHARSINIELHLNLLHRFICAFVQTGLLSEIMDALRAEYEEKVKAHEDYGPSEVHEGTADSDGEPVLRSRAMVAKQLLSLGLVANREELGRNRKSTRKSLTQRKRKAWEDEVEEIGSRISMLKRTKNKKSRGRRRAADDSSPELGFTNGDDNERFSDEEASLRAVSSDESDEDGDDENTNPVRFSQVVKYASFAIRLCFIVY